MYRVELAKAARRWRTWLVAAALGGIPALIVIAVKLSPPANGGGQDAPPFLMQIVRNGLFAPLTGLAVIQPFFLPLAAGLFAGDAIAGEAQGGTLRYLLVRPVGRARLVLAKYAGAMTLLGLMLLWVVAVGIAFGAVAFGLGPLPTLSGSTLGTGSAVLRIVGAATYMFLVVSGIVAVGTFISTLTDSGPGATVATVILGIASEIVDNIPNLKVVHPYLPTHGWLAFADLFRFPIAWGAMWDGVIVSLVYTVVFLGAALLWFRRKDVAS
ncbi:MAG TPA: ABC transporter permease subunit [Actinomycetota bacterium]|nr:ABC transporter permease subunit [Actinomycetota bacterium]